MLIGDFRLESKRACQRDHSKPDVHSLAENGRFES
jgi:hypothetical protein